MKLLSQAVGATVAILSVVTGGKAEDDPAELAQACPDYAEYSANPQ
jgi:hypothetical protein